MLAFLPGENAYQRDVVKTKSFVAVADHVQSLTSFENTKRPEHETEEPHPLSSFEPVIPVAPSQTVPYSAFSFQYDTTSYYSIRAPPAQA